MKLVCTSDWHVDWVTHGVRRADEVTAAVDKSVEHAITLSKNERVAYAFLGDLCDPDSNPTGIFAAQRALLTAVQKLVRNDIPSIWLVGNHDVVEDGLGTTTLDALLGFGPGNDHLMLAKSPGIYSLATDVNILALPFTPTSHSYDPAALARARAGEFNVVMSHLIVPGIQPGEETTEMPRGRDTLFPFDETTHALRLQGHYHRRHEFKPPVGSPIYVVGSLAALTFGEQDNRPGYIVAEVP